MMYQPSSTDKGFSGDLTAMKTWTFNFKNCKYNGVKISDNAFGEHKQVFYMYNVGNDNSLRDPELYGFVLNFE